MQWKEGDIVIIDWHTWSTEGPAVILAEAMKDLKPEADMLVIKWDKNEDAPKPNNMRRGAFLNVLFKREEHEEETVRGCGVGVAQ
jgi:hypothetical protein